MFTFQYMDDTNCTQDTESNPPAPQSVAEYDGTAAFVVVFVAILVAMQHLTLLQNGCVC